MLLDGKENAPDSEQLFIPDDAATAAVLPPLASWEVQPSDSGLCLTAAWHAVVLVAAGGEWRSRLQVNCCPPRLLYRRPWLRLHCRLVWLRLRCRLRR